MDDGIRLDVARTSARDVLSDWARHGGPAQDVRVWLDADGHICIWVNGGGTTPSACGQEPIELAVSAAEHLHAELMDEAHRVVPVCAVHSCGLHPTPTDKGPAWRCSVGDHLLGAIGTLPGV